MLRSYPLNLKDLRVAQGKVLHLACGSIWTMNITVNNEHKEVTAKSLLGVLKELNLFQERGLAAAVNGHLIPKTTWENHPIQNEDQIILIQATQGG